MNRPVRKLPSQNTKTMHDSNGSIPNSHTDVNDFFNELNGIERENANPTMPTDQSQVPQYPTKKTFKYANDCSISIGCTPSGFATLLIYIDDTPFFGVGTMFSLSALEITNAEIYYNSKTDFLLDEDIDPYSTLPLDTDRERRLHKISVYKIPETTEYRMDLVKLAKTGIPEIDAQDPWKDFNDLDDYGSGQQIELVKKFTDLLCVSRNEPDMIITGQIPEKYPELEPCVGIVAFKRVK